MIVGNSVLQGKLARGTNMWAIRFHGWIMPFTITFVVYALLLLAGLLILKQTSIGVDSAQRHEAQAVAAHAATMFQNSLAETLSVTAAADSWFEVTGSLAGFSDYISSTDMYRGVHGIELLMYGNHRRIDGAQFVDDYVPGQTQAERLHVVVPTLRNDGMVAGQGVGSHYWRVEINLRELWQTSGVQPLLADYYYDLSLNDKDKGVVLPLLGKYVDSISEPETASLQVLDAGLSLSLAPTGGWRPGLPKAGIAAVVAIAAAMSLVLLHLLMQYRRTTSHALHDPLTGLPNRVLLEERARMALAQARRDKRAVAVLFIDLDGFKTVNDRFGHATGDALLRTLTEDLAQHIRGIDTFARIGGDEFVLLLTGMSDVGYAHLVANKMLWRTAQPIVIGNDKMTVGASIGVSMYPDDGGDVATLLHNADAAMYQAKRAGGGRYHVVTAAERQLHTH